LEENNGWYFILKYQNDNDLSFQCFTKNQNNYYLLGEIYNIDEIRVCLTQYDSKALNCNVAELIVLLGDNLGDKGFSLIEGNFSLIYSLDDGSLKIITDQLGQTRIFKVWGEDFYITSELKILSLAESNIFDFHKFEDFYKLNKIYGDCFIPIKNCARIKPGHITLIRRNEVYYSNSKEFAGFNLSEDKDLQCDYIDNLPVVE